ncbi:allantoicase [Angustibacter sp. McL0619]|uniref:allantoicase n=1 Tax=Angustibacter sp. McL0619 TaxID=3415676 RepID=UPI003CF42429
MTDQPDGRTDQLAAALRLPDLAVRTLGGSVVWANDEHFAERENLIRPGPASFDPTAFGHKGKVYDGWETRRRREPGHDEALVRLGVAGIVRAVVVDTSWFTGNFPPRVSVEGACVDGYPSVPELREASWTTLVSPSAVRGDAQNVFAVPHEGRLTHVRLRMFPDGGVARLRVHGQVVPDPQLLDGELDLAALEHGGAVVGCSDLFYGAPTNLISPGLPRSMADGWETARRRDDGNDWVTVRLAAAGTVRLAELDTSYYVGNAPGWAGLRGSDCADREPGADDWFELLARTRLQPDTRHRLRVPASEQVTHVRLDVYPDGGMARLRLWGSLTAAGRERIERHWRDSAPNPRGDDG